MNLTFKDELDIYGLSGPLWSKFALPEGGNFVRTASGNPAIGFFDHFLKTGGTSVHDGYFRLETGSATVAQIASDWDETSATTKTQTGLGVCRLLNTAADNDEAVLAWGAGLDAPFKLINHDLVFECRMKLSDITISSHGFFVGLGELGCQATTKVIDASDAVDNTYDLIGYQQLKAETSAVDGMYQLGGVTKVDGAVNTDLDTLATLVAGTYHKLGFRFNSLSNTIHWYVNGVEDVAARLKITDLTASTFPDDNFMTPVVALVNDGTTACNLDLDWWACAQAIGGS